METIGNWLAIIIGVLALDWFVNKIFNVNDKMTSADVQANSMVSLSSFIEDNHKLITTLGVFTALTVFVSNLPLKIMGYLLSFLFLTGTVLVWLELISKFPKPRTTRLLWFENVLGIAVMILITYWVLEFRSIWRPLLTMILMITFLWISSLIIKRSNLFEFIFRMPVFRHSAPRYIVGIIVIGIVLILAAELVILFAPPINILLEEIRRQLDLVTLTTP